MKTLFLVVVVLFTCHYAQATEPTRGDESIEALIDQLPSKFAAPNWPDGDVRGRPRFPVSFDERDPARVVAAWDRLIAAGETAMPVLLRHLNDNRHSCTVRSYGFYRNLGVGDVCLDIIITQIEVYQRCTRFIHEPPCHGRPKFVPRKKGDFIHWWDNNKKKSLRELQKEGIEFAIRTENECGNFEDEEQEKTILGSLNDLLETLRRSRDPIAGIRQCRVLQKGEK